MRSDELKRLQAKEKRERLERTFEFQLKAAKVTGWKREFVFHPIRRFRFDFAFVDQLLAVEIDGATWSNGRHNRGYGIESDAEKYSLAAAMGWRIIRLTKTTVEDGSGLKLLQEALNSGR